MLGNFGRELALQLEVFTIFTGPAATANHAESPRHGVDQPTVSPQSARHLQPQPRPATVQPSPAHPFLMVLILERLRRVLKFL